MDVDRIPAAANLVVPTVEVEVIAADEAFSGEL